jgi:hypothetical protein
MLSDLQFLVYGHKYINGDMTQFVTIKNRIKCTVVHHIPFYNLELFNGCRVPSVYFKAEQFRNLKNFGNIELDCY